MDQIKIYDNFFDKEDIDYIKHTIFESKSYNDCIYRHYQNRFGAKAYYQYPLDNYTFFSDYCKQLFSHRIVERKFRIIRCNLLSQSYGQSGSFHVDHPRVNGLTEYKNHQNPNTKEFTIMLYININEDSESNSSIIFKTDQKHIVEFETKNNRIILFPAHYYHYPGHHNEGNSSYIRTAITFKCEYID
jgi:hypothetical protein